MSKHQEEDITERRLEDIDEALTSSEHFIEKNQKTLLWGLLVVVVLVGGFIAFNHFHKKPRDLKAQAAIFKGERFFQNQQDSIAIFGNGNDYIGFEAIIKEYSGTKTADLAHAYAGLSYNRLGNNEKALEHLKKFKGGDLLITPAVMGAIGDVYMDMGKTTEAISQFNNAAKKANDEMLSPIYYKKVGLAYLTTENLDKAIEVFEMIKDKYLNSPEAQEADKFIEAAKLSKTK